MTFDYTDAQLVVALPDLKLQASVGRVDGVLPILLRLDWNDSEALCAMAADPPTRDVLADILYTHRRNLENGWPALFRPDLVIELEERNPFPHDSGASDRWLTETMRPSLDDAADLVARLAEHGWMEGLNTLDTQLREWLERLVERASSLQDATSTLVPFSTELQVRWDDKGRLRLVAAGFSDPYDRARLEAMSAYTKGGPGLVRCDVCERLFVPLRAGRPTRRCPGFECDQVAKRRYQHTPERREYRRLSSRLSRAKAAGNRAAIDLAQAAIEDFKDRSSA